MSLTVRWLVLSLLLVAAVCAYVYVFVAMETDLPCIADGVALLRGAACQP